MEVGLVQRIDIDEEMQQAYLDYAMSVIVARALPDSRDGLKPVHRRILYAMFDMGIRPDSPYKKSARIVGEVLGKYHPHGDEAVYESMARMAQDFSMRYRLIDGQGNFGSIDGDAPAAMRYTEARLAEQAMQMLGDINKNTVLFTPNFDGTLTEPSVLPAALPNLLVNGATGIAVGMATSIPPHNLLEVIDAIHFLLENWEKQDDITVEDLMKFVPGPDFPTGGLIIQESGGDGLVSAYSTGRGRVTMQASAHLEEMERGRSRIIVNELPYMTNKSALIERIASLVREEKLEGIADLRDESDRQGMRIVIELTKTASPEEVLSGLYKNTPMQSTFSIIMLALVDGEPRLLSLKQSLRVFIEHRLEIIRRRSEFDLERARQRAHILEGLRIALNNLDEVIAIIRKSPDAETARERLIKRFKLSAIQTQAILDMPLRRLAALERKKIEDEFREVLAIIKDLESLLKSPKKMRQVVDHELQVVKETFGDRRRTHIVQLKAGETKVSVLTSTELKPDKLIWLSVTADGLISRSLDEKMPQLSGKDSPRWLIQANTRDTLYLVCTNGEAAAVAVHAVPESAEPAGGTPIYKVSALREGTTLADLFTLPPKDRRSGPASQTEAERYIVTVTQQGMVKKSPVSELPGPSANTFILTRVNERDQLGWLAISDGKGEILLVTQSGMAIRFNEDEVRPMGLVAAGVLGIKLQSADLVAGVEMLPGVGEVFMIAANGSAKRVPIDQFPRQGRYGLGVIAWKMPANTRLAGMTVGKGTRRVILRQSRLAPRVIRLDEAPLTTRASRGQVIDELKPGDRITGITTPREIEAVAARKAKSGDETGSQERKRIIKPATARQKPALPAKPAPKTTRPDSQISSPTKASPAGAKTAPTPAAAKSKVSSRTKSTTTTITTDKPASAKTAPVKKATKAAAVKTPAAKPPAAAATRKPAPKADTAAGSASKQKAPTTKNSTDKTAAPKSAPAAAPAKAKTEQPQAKTSQSSRSKPKAANETQPARHPGGQKTPAKPPTTSTGTKNQARSGQTKQKSSPAKPETGSKPATSRARKTPSGGSTTGKP
jgi:DNA gyrase subunit A